MVQYLKNLKSGPCEVFEVGQEFILERKHEKYVCVILGGR